MDRLFEIYNELSDQGVRLYDYRIEGSLAATIEMGGKYAVFLDASQIESSSEERCVVAHEAGHIMTGSTHSVYSPLQIIQQKENKADRWAIRKLIPPADLQTALNNGITEIWALAEHFDVTEDFMKKACELYIHRLDLIKEKDRPGRQPEAVSYGVDD